MRSARWFISYGLIAFAGLSMAFLLSFKFASSAHSQTGKLEAPSAGDLPAEFLSETGDAKNGKAASAAPGKGTAIPSAPSQAATPTPTPAIPPPPADAAKSVAPPVNTATVKEVTNPNVSNAGTAPNPNGTVSDGATAPAISSNALGAPEEYVYDPTGRRDPFRPFPGLIPLDKAKGPKANPTDPLQRWEVERFQVVGILWEVNSPRAMIKDPDGTIFTVVKNTKVGRNNGYVTAIREGEVVIVQTVEFEGTVSKETKILELGK